MVFNATFNNISVIYRGINFYGWSKLEKTTDHVKSHRQTFSHNVVSSTSCLSGIRTHNVSGDRH